MSSYINLPRFLKLKDTIFGRGVFTKEPITRAKTIFTSKPFSFGVGGVTLEQVRTICHHCMMHVRGPAVICSECQVVGYCNDACRDSAMALHAMECKGLLQLEKLRGDSNALQIVNEDDQTVYWPPPMVLTVARAINKQTLLLGGDHSEAAENLIEYLSWNESNMKVKAYPLLYPYVRMLVPDDLTCDIYQAFCAVSVNAASVFDVPSGTSAKALFIDYSIVNHMCRPNSEWEMEDGRVHVYAAHDIEGGAQLGISYLNDEYTLIVREIRRERLKQGFGFDCQCFVCLGEEVPGSSYWLVDQQKRSLIAPWSLEMAKKMMDKGWGLLCESKHADLSPAQVIHMLESEQAVIKRVLDQRNIIVILMARRLISKYIEAEEYEKAIKQFEEVIKKIIGVLTDKYASPCYVHSILLEIVVCLCKLGRTEESLTMAKGIIEQFPKVTSVDLLLSVLLHSGSLCLADRVRFENLRKLCICYSNAGIEPPKGLKTSKKARVLEDN